MTFENIESKFIWLGLLFGSTIGSYVPLLWGAGLFSFSSLILGLIGGLVGIWVGLKIGQ